MDEQRTMDVGDGSQERPRGPLRLLVMWEGESLGVDLPPCGELRIGRAKQCDVVVEHASVSRKHVVIEVTDRVRIRDLGSQNGTRLAGRRLDPGEVAAFEPGLVAQIGHAVLLLQARDALTTLPAPVDEAPLPPLDGLVVPSHGAMHQVYRLTAHVAKSRLSVLLLGETGVGKEIVCEAIHRWSPRREGPFVRLNCAALPEPLLESELFGHEKGSFTGAGHTKQGLIEAADGGTLFLDEVGEMPLATQVRLLRVLEAREVLRVGAVKARPVDMRVVAATHRDLDAAMKSGAFRADLFYRLNGVSLVIPPLRARTSEIEPLALAFARRACEESQRPQVVLAPETLATLRAHTWPGNVRELRNVIERAIALSTGTRIEPRHLLEPSFAPAAVAARRAETTPRPSSVPPSAGTGGAVALSDEMSELEKKRILDALERNDGNQSKAATELGIPRRTLVRRLGEYGLTRPRSR